MSQILISFCNVFPRGLALGILEYETEKFGWIDTNTISENIMGVDGISTNNEKYNAIIQLAEGGVCGLSIFNKHLQLERNYNLIEANDAHSLISYGNGFLVTDTGKNRIIQISFEGDGNKITETEIWRYNDDRKDTVHVNSIAIIGNRIFVSLFGTRLSNGWRDVKSGKIIDISTNTVVVDNLYHPHSLIAIDETLYWLESGTGMIHKYSEKNGHEIFLKVEGYLRGMTFDKKYLYVASSGKRRTSRSTGVPNISQSNSEYESRSWIYRINKKNRNFERKELTSYGTEVYDLLLLEKKYDMSVYENPITLRLWKYEDEYFNRLKYLLVDSQFRSIIRDYINNREWDKAIPHIKQILDNFEDSEMEYLLALIMQLKVETPEKSLEYYDLALIHGFDEFWVRYNRGQLYTTLGKIDLAIIDLERALVLHPNDEIISQLLNNLKNNVQNSQGQIN